MFLSLFVAFSFVNLDFSTFNCVLEISTTRRNISPPLSRNFSFAYASYYLWNPLRGKLMLSLPLYGPITCYMFCSPNRLQLVVMVCRVWSGKSHFWRWSSVVCELLCVRCRPCDNECCPCRLEGLFYPPGTCYNSLVNKMQNSPFVRRIR